MDDTREDALRSALTSIIARYETGQEVNLIGPAALAALNRAMALDALRGLADAYPDDLFYRARLNLWEHERGG